MQKKVAMVIGEFKKGDPEAYSQLHAEFFDTIYYFARRLVKSKDDADDIVAEVFTKLWKRRSDFETYANIKAFLFIATRNACFNFLLDQSRKAAKKEDIANRQTGIEPPLYRPELLEEETIRAELVEYFNNEVKKFPRQMRKIFEMRVKKNLPNAVIADKLAISEVNVRNVISQGMQRLRKKRGLQKRWMLLRMLMRY